MKKVVLIIICVIIGLFFVAFNYLLWDRVNMDKDMEAAALRNSYKVYDLTTEIEKLKAEKQQLDLLVQKLTDEKHALSKEKLVLLSESNDLKLDSQKIDAFVGMLLQGTDFTAAHLSIKQWIESINTSDYKAASELMTQNYLSEEVQNQYKEKIKTIKLKEILPLDIPKLKAKISDIKSIEEISMTFQVIAQLKLSESATHPIFINGNNLIDFRLKYDLDKKSWIIIDLQRVDQ